MIRTGIFLLSALWLGVATPLSACQVPVFRYALERWWPDFYTLAVVHKGGLTPELVGLLEPYMESSDLANLDIEIIDLETADARTLSRFRGIAEISETPALALYYPDAPTDEPPVFTAPFSEKNLGLIIDSPARQKIASRILEGDSAVWVVLDGGSGDAQNEVIRLESGLKELAGYMELPEGVITPDEADELMESARAGDPPPPGFDAENILNYGVPLRLGFSVVTVDANAPEEAAFIRMVLAADPDLDPSAGPVTVPIFGRGRMLQGLPVKTLLDEDILPDACYYICGACSCQVKGQNPGLDLLMKVDWESALEGSSVMVEKELPALTGTGDITGSNPSDPVIKGDPKNVSAAVQPSRSIGGPMPAPNPEVSPKAPKAPTFGNPVLGWITGAVTAAGLVIATASFIILKRNNH